ncbi:hypothetical protein MHU86_11022 [Fragilaria crotonensis]|nr:hypothetical protein MHU86_11022 [Fragilaria crotonensis]
MNTFWGSVGGGLGPILGGIVYERYGAKFMFRNAGGIVLGTLVLHVILWITGCFGYDQFLREKASYKLLSMTPEVELSALESYRDEEEDMQSDEERDVHDD